VKPAFSEDSSLTAYNRVTRASDGRLVSGFAVKNFFLLESGTKSHTKSAGCGLQTFSVE
jgi:hypothetical protein